MLYLILIAAILLSSAKSLLMRGVSNGTDDKTVFWKNNMIIFLVAFFIIAIFFGKKVIEVPPSPYTIVLSILFALFTTLAQVLYIYAQSMGSVSFNTFVYSCGFIIPAIYGIFVDTGTLTIYQPIALIMLVAVMYFYMLPKKEKFSPLHLFYILTATLFAGIIAIIQKLHQNSAYQVEFESFLSLAFAMCFVLSLLSYFFFKAKNGKKEPKEAKCKLTLSDILPVILGLVIAFQNRCTLFLSGKMPAIIFFPVFNGAVVICTGIFAALLFKEKLCKRQIICLGFGIISILLFNI